MNARAKPTNPWSTPTATLVLPASAPREQWLAERRKGLGSSDAALLMGAGYPDDSEYALWLDKTGRAKPGQQTGAMQRGVWLEPHVADYFADTTRLKLRRCGLVRHKDDPVLLATPDRLTADGGVVEIKCLDVATPILTTEGWVAMGDLQVGDEVFQPDGHPVRVVGTSPVLFGKRCYRITTNDGRSVVADADHIWTVWDVNRSGARRIHGGGLPWEELTTTQLLDRGVRCSSNRRLRFQLPEQHILITKPVDLPLDPYLLGAWLGDGTTLNGGITVGSADLDEMCSLLELVTGVPLPEPRPTGTAWTIRPQLALNEHHIPSAPSFTPERLQLAEWAVANGFGHDKVALALGIHRKLLTRALARLTGEAEPLRPTFASRLRELGVLGNKHVPDVYLLAGTEQRLALLQGLLDADGGISTRGQVTFCSTTEQIVTAVQYLARSLGWNATIRPYGRGAKPYWLVRFTPTAGDPPPFRLTRKLRRVMLTTTQTRRPRVASIEPVSTRPVRCIRVDSPDGLFLAGRDLVPTHNTLGSWAKTRAEWRDGIARHAYVQAQWQLMVSGRSHAWFCAYAIDAEPMVRGPVERDEALINRMRDRAMSWWETHINGGEEPPVDLATITDEEIALRWPSSVPGSTTQAEWPAYLRQLLVERAELKAAEKAAKDRAKEIDQALRVMAGPSEALLLGQRPVVTLKEQPNNPSVDPALKTDLPEVWEKYVKRTSSRRIHVVRGWEKV